MNAAASPSDSATRAEIAIRLNDEPRLIRAGTSVLDLLAALDLAERKGLAVAINGSVVPRTSWPDRVLIENDQVLVIRATQGG